jgi:hypothetical protein
MIQDPKTNNASGAWIVFPTYMIYVFGSEILEGLEMAAGLPPKKFL